MEFSPPATEFPGEIPIGDSQLISFGWRRELHPTAIADSLLIALIEFHIWYP